MSEEDAKFFVVEVESRFVEELDDTQVLFVEEVALGETVEGLDVVLSECVPVLAQSDDFVGIEDCRLIAVCLLALVDLLLQVP